ncbi:MAG: hypothetical protein ACC653_10545 [Gammaproteobacteria bacterium]
MNLSKLNPFINSPTVNENNFETIITCAIEHLDYCKEPGDRILLNSIIALENSIKSAQNNNKASQTKNKKCLFYILTPEASQDKTKNIELDEWYEIFTDEENLLADFVDLDNIEIKFEQYSELAINNLTILCEKLSAGEWDTIIFGGINNSVNSFINEFNQQSQGQTQKKPRSITTAEDVVFLILESDNYSKTYKNNIIDLMTYTKDISQKMTDIVLSSVSIITLLHTIMKKIELKIFRQIVTNYL